MDAKDGIPVEVKTADGVLLTRTLSIPLETSQNPEQLFKKLGLKAWQPVVPPMIGRIIEDSVAAESGLQVGDLILSVQSLAIHGNPQGSVRRHQFFLLSSHSQ
jgi:regulator of sigma E protease